MDTDVSHEVERRLSRLEEKVGINDDDSEDADDTEEGDTEEEEDTENE